MPRRQLNTSISREDLERLARERHLPRELSHMGLTSILAKTDGKNELQSIVIVFTEIDHKSTVEEEVPYWLVERIDRGYPEWLVYQEGSPHMGWWSTSVHRSTILPYGEAVELAKTVYSTLGVSAVATEHVDIGIR